MWRPPELGNISNFSRSKRIFPSLLLPLCFPSPRFILLHQILVALHGVFLASCGIFSCGMQNLVPWPGIKPRPLALGAWSLNHWTTRESLDVPFLIPLHEKSPREGNGKPLQCSCLARHMNRGAWKAAVHGVARVGHNLVTKPPPWWEEPLLTSLIKVRTSISPYFTGV